MYEIIEDINNGMDPIRFMETQKGYIREAALNFFKRCPKCGYISVKGFLGCHCLITCDRCMIIYNPRIEMCHCYKEVEECV